MSSPRRRRWRTPLGVGGRGGRGRGRAALTGAEGHAVQGVASGVASRHLGRLGQAAKQSPGQSQNSGALALPWGPHARGLTPFGAAALGRDGQEGGQSRLPPQPPPLHSAPMMGGARSPGGEGAVTAAATHTILAGGHSEEVELEVAVNGGESSTCDGGHARLVVCQWPTNHHPHPHDVIQSCPRSALERL